jgi:CRP-like cAMP-binding protein
MYFIVSGEVEVDTETAAAKGRLDAGEFFGEIALIADRERTATITALTPCKLLVLHKDDFERFMNQHPDLKDAVRDAAVRRLEELKLR